ncbi:PAQR family membrane homeostasis protein TrhA [Vibrio rarus]|uniref:PAQR family membrane homeostasis protein TrhA n=1 Tax=Vibrio rarus TaxID=413403 RepID=UPI0021C27F63|nr:hemolysin III family protein [Vibrio rarus]
MSNADKNAYSKNEELANSLSHGLGMIFAIAALVMLLNQAFAHNADTLTIVSMAIYGSSMIILFLASTLYHAVPYQKAKRLLKTFDHSAIYLLIAGSYTPFLLVGLRTPLAIGLMVVIWCIAILGIVMKLVFVYRFKRFSLISYIVMGWLSLIIVYQMAMNLPMGALTFLAIGGGFYSFGVIFYVGKRIPFNHAIWHCFVLAGAVSHFFAIYFYIKPV